MIVTNTYKCNKMFLTNVKCIPTKCKPTFGSPCTYEEELFKTYVVVAVVVRTASNPMSDSSDRQADRHEGRYAQAGRQVCSQTGRQA